MDLAKARELIEAAIARMQASYRQAVFDEWAILSTSGKLNGIVAYKGPRADVFRSRLPEDSAPLRAATRGKEISEGDIEFIPDAADTRYDAFMKLGPASFLILNHTVKTMDEIRADGKWLNAQVALFELSEKFRSDPLTV